MAQVRNYTIRFYGGSQGMAGIHAQVHLFGNDNVMLGWINFRDSGTEKDDQTGDHLIMEMSKDMVQPVLTMLTQEAPVYFHWQKAIKLAYFGSGQEPVGEAEGK